MNWGSFTLGIVFGWVLWLLATFLKMILDNYIENKIEEAKE